MTTDAEKKYSRIIDRGALLHGHFLFAVVGLAFFVVFIRFSFLNEFRSKISANLGQSLIEFLFMLPLVLGFAVIMIRVNTAIQASIVNQKYARAQLQFLTFNSPFYPESGQRLALEAAKMNQLTVGVSETKPPDPTENGMEPFQPDAPMFPITRIKQQAKDPTAQELPNESTKVLIRNTVTLCTQPVVIKSGKGFIPVHMMPEGMKAADFMFCKGIGNE